MAGENNATFVTFITVNTTKNQDLSHIVHEIFQLMTNVCLINVFAIFGIAGNTVNIIVLRRHGIVKDSTNILLIVLSFFDLMYSAIAIVRHSTYLITLGDRRLAVMLHSWLVGHSIYGTDQICISISVTITSAIGIERFIAVFFPFHVARIFTPVKTKIMICFIIVYTLSILGPFFNIYEKFWIFDKTSNTTKFGYRLTVWYTSHAYYFIYVTNHLLGTANMIIVLTCGLAITLKLAYSARTRQKLVSKTIVADMKVHKMTLLVCGFCFLTFAPTTVMDNTSFYYPAVFSDLKFVYYLLYGTSASVNFLIYVTISKKFYTTYKRIFCRK